MSTRAYLTIIPGDDRIIDSAFCPSSAYPSYLGLEVLDAVSKGQFPQLLESIRADYPHEKDMLEDLQRSDYVKGKGDKDRYFFDYAYEYDLSKSTLNLYNYGEKALTITPENLSVCKFIFEKEEDLYYPLSLDEKTMTLKRDFYKEVRSMLRNGATKQEFQKVLDQNPSVLYLNQGRIMDVAGRDYKTNFRKEVCESHQSERLIFCANDFHNTGKFSLSVQTPFYRAPVATRPLKSAASVERELASMVRERPDDIRGTSHLFKQLDAYQKAVRKVYEDASLTLEERSVQATALREEILGALNGCKGAFHIIGPTHEMLNREISDVVYRNHRWAQERAVEEEKHRTTSALDSMVSSASERSAQSQPHSLPQKNAPEHQL